MATVFDSNDPVTLTPKLLGKGPRRRRTPLASAPMGCVRYVQAKKLHNTPAGNYTARCNGAIFRAVTIGSDYLKSPDAEYDKYLEYCKDFKVFNRSEGVPLFAWLYRDARRLFGKNLEDWLTFACWDYGRLPDDERIRWAKAAADKDVKMQAIDDEAFAVLQRIVSA